MKNSHQTTAQHVAVGLGLVGGLLVIVGAALPWLDTGGVRRSVFTLARVANELGLLDQTRKKVAVYALLAMPFLAPIALISWSMRWRIVTYLVVFLIATVGILSGIAGLLFSKGLLGPKVTFVGGVFALIGGIGAAVFHQRNQRSESNDSLR
jgi:hypothetical protein